MINFIYLFLNEAELNPLFCKYKVNRSHKNLDIDRYIFPSFLGTSLDNMSELWHLLFVDVRSFSRLSISL